MGLGEAEFWRLTLAQFAALSARYRDQQEWLDYRAALVCSVLAEVNRDRKKRARPFSPKDFMPGRQRSPQPRTAAELQEKIERAMFVAGGRREVKKDG